MAVINDELKAIIDDPGTFKVLGSVDKNGIPHVTYKNSIRVNDDGNLEYYEILESAQSNKNMVYSIWFDKKVSINILSKEKESYEIIGKPVKSITSGKEFEKTYEALRQSKGDIDLAAIWVIQPETVKNETFSVRIAEDEKRYPIIKHLDRLFKG